jgi:hypothetical protein
VLFAREQIIAEFDEAPPCDDSLRMTSHSHNGDVMLSYVTGNNNNNNNSKNIFIGVDLSCGMQLLCNHCFIITLMIDTENST